MKSKYPPGYIPPEHLDALAQIERTNNLEPMFDNGQDVLDATIKLYLGAYSDEQIAPRDLLEKEIAHLIDIRDADQEITIDEAFEVSKASYRRLQGQH